MKKAFEKAGQISHLIRDVVFGVACVDCQNRIEASSNRWMKGAHTKSSL